VSFYAGRRVERTGRPGEALAGGQRCEPRKQRLSGGGLDFQGHRAPAQLGQAAAVTACAPPDPPPHLPPSPADQDKPPPPLPLDEDHLILRLDSAKAPAAAAARGLKTRHRPRTI
jgi:hypothetical protein